ncbi:glycosyltransferase [Desulforegula conservatrix]|uniref:glycosyltransferase n=1 Tax=Desulforegula conservatrix TaxID=153026 RepID=UPI000414F576|nr:glycosyltransferase [Desulforegula conservatrix]
MRLLLFPVGSYGDVYPMLGLGVELKKRGHEIIVCTYGYFEDLVKETGLDFKMVGTKEQYLDTISHPDLWNPLKSFLHLFKMGGDTIMRGQYEAAKELNLPGRTLIAASCLATGARLANEKLGIPLVSVLYQPTALWSDYETPRFYGLATGKNVPKILKRAQYYILHMLLFGPTITRGTNQFRKELGLPLIAKIDPWLLSEECILNLFTDWFAQIQPDWPANIFYGGFPLWDGAEVTPLQPEVQEFMENGLPPVIFTPGTANMHAEKFFRIAADVCFEMGVRGVFLSRFSHQIPASLPEGVVHFEYAPLSRLLKGSTAIVHHGGIGTTAQALSCGTPQIIMPFSFDQFDNADRIERLGAGLAIKSSEFSHQTLKRALGQIIDQNGHRNKCAEISSRFGEKNPVDESCDIIDGFIAKKFG